MTDLRHLEGERYSTNERAETREYLTRVLRSTGWRVEEQVFATGVNLIAIWPLSQPNAAHLDPSKKRSPKKLLIGAHYDTVADSPGADDNATGVAALLEIGRVYAGASDLILVFFDREEQGLEGSLAFATPERVMGLKGAIVLEMLGFTCQEVGCQSYPEFLEERPKNNQRNQGDFIAAIGDAEHPELLEAFELPQSQDTSLCPVFTLSVPFKGMLTPDVMRSDHSPFWLRGLGAVMVTDTANLRNPHYHRTSDRLETLDLVFLEQVTNRIAVAIAQLRHASIEMSQLQSSLASPPLR